MFIAIQNTQQEINHKDLIEKVLDRVTPYIPLGYQNKPYIFIKDTYIIFSFIRDEIEKIKITESKKHSIFYDGYINEDLNFDDSNINKLGGVNCQLILSNDSITCKTTSASLFSIYYTLNERVIISSRPLLVELLRSINKNRIEINNQTNDIFNRIAFGSWISGSTGFTNVKRMLPNEQLKISLKDNSHSFNKIKLFFEDDFTCTDLTESTKNLSESLINSVSESGEKTLLMSGGKDSRTIAAALDGSHQEFSGIITGHPESEEVLVAKKLGTKCDSLIKLDVQSQIAFYDPIYAAMLSSLRTEGQVSNVAHQIYFDKSNFYNGITYHGHGHLLRGGFGGWPESASPEDYRKKLLSAFITGWINSNDSTAPILFLEDFYKDIGFNEKSGFYAHLNFRVGAYQAPGILEMTGLNEVRYPLCDEDTVNTARKICLSDLNKEKAVFSSIKKLSPNMALTPLYGDNWSFEKTHEDPLFPNRESRISKIDKNNQKINKSGLIFIGEKNSLSNESLAAKFIIESGFIDEIKDFISPRMSEIIYSYAKNNKLPDYELTMRRPVQESGKRKMLEIFGIAVNCKTNWLVPIRRATRKYISIKYI